MKLKVEGGYPEVNELYMKVCMVISPYYLDMDKNRDRRKYN